MKKIILALLALALATPAFAINPASFTFTITSSAQTSTPNLKVVWMHGTLARDGNNAIQAFVPGLIDTYYLTKSTTITTPENATAVFFQVDQDTNMYLGSDLTNSILLYSGTNSPIFGLRR